MSYALLADLIVVIHFAFVAFVVGGQCVILLGAPLHWRWIRNPWFRLVHVAVIVIVAIDSLFGILCPLTTWEYELRRKAGQVVETDISFVGRMVRAVIFYEAPPWVFTVVYVAFALLVVATLVVVPPRWRRVAVQ